jgi:hypothetical protein
MLEPKIENVSSECFVVEPKHGLKLKARMAQAS